jgi:spore photoproduct lyase
MPSESARAHDQVKLWHPRQILMTPAAREFAHGREIAEKAASMGAEIVELSSNRLTGLASDDSRRAYIDAKSTLAVVISPASKRKLQPIPPSADWRFDEGAA